MEIWKIRKIYAPYCVRSQIYHRFRNGQLRRPSATSCIKNRTAITRPWLGPRQSPVVLVAIFAVVVLQAIFRPLPSAPYPAQSCVIDGEAIVCDETGLAVFGTRMVCVGLDLDAGHAIRTAVECRVFDPMSQFGSVSVR
jgi:hypothetical protein